MKPRADIAKCAGTGCARRNSCVRFLAPEAEPFQNWIKHEPVDCQNFADVAEYGHLYAPAQGGDQ